MRSYCNRTDPQTMSELDGSEIEISRYGDGYNIRAVTSRRPMQTGVLSEALSKVIGCIEGENCGGGGKAGGGSLGAGEGEGEVVKSITV